MKNIYTLWAVALASFLEVGIFYLYYCELIGNATALASAFAVGAVVVTAVVLRDGAFDYRDNPRDTQSRD
jgi:hypothetical protein